MKRLSLILIGLFLFQICNAQSPKSIDWNSDLDYLAKELPQRHYDFFTTKSKGDYVLGLNKIRSSRDGLTDFEVALKLQQLIASFGDSHTNINYGKFLDKSQILPLHLYWFSDGLFILHTTQENGEVLGHQILSINGVPLQTVVDSLGTLTTRDNQAIVKSAIPKLLPLVQVLEYFGFVKNQKIELGLKDELGKTKDWVIKPAVMNRTNRQIYKTDSIALCFRNERVYFIDYYLPIDKVYYLQYNKCWSKELELQLGDKNNAETLPSFSAFENKVFQTLKNKTVNKIVIDLRFNEGRNSAQGTEFIAKLKKHLTENPALKVYVILGRFTFSSAILNAMDCKQLPNVVFVGEDTAGKPNHFGEIKKFQLPASGIDVAVSTKYFNRTSEKMNTLTPDVKLESSFADFSKGIDPAYEWIKRQ